MGGLLRILLLLGFVVKFWWLILLTLAIAAAGCWLWVVMTRHDAKFEGRRQADAALVARADEQHAQIMAGDDRGMYGDYRPTQIA